MSAGRQHGRPPVTALPPRLVAVAGFVPPGERVADIGCGDGRLAAYLAVVRKCRVIATEASLAGFGLARQRLEPYADRIEVRWGRGLAPLRPGEVEVVIVAGMGGITIADILETSPRGRHPRYFVLQPMARTAYLRQWLARAGWRLLDEELVEDRGRFYEIILTAPTGGKAGGEKALLLAQGEVGPLLFARRHPLLLPFLRERLRRYRRLAAQLQGAPGPIREKVLAVLGELEELAAALSINGE
ncbi:MAG: tRNA (adenine(22)-N(1))-methyltransferase [Moorellales bacterium]